MHKSIPLVLDTSIFKQTPKLNSQLFTLLIRYVNLGIFRLYIPEIIEKEYLTWITKESQLAYDTAAKATESLSKFSDAFSGMNVAAFVAANQINDILKSATENWNLFKIRTKSVTLPILDKHGKIVMDAYFSGDTPFKEKKSRQDIPDAFIYYAINDLLAENENVIFVAQDKNFLKKIANEKFKTFENLSELFSKSEFKISKEFFGEVTSEQRLHKILRYYYEDVIKKIERSIELTDFVTVTERKLLLNVIGSPKEVITDVRNLFIDIDSAKIIADNSCIISFTATLLCDKRSKSSHDEMASLSESSLKRISEKEINDDGEYDITEVVHVFIKGNASISFENTNPLEWDEKSIVMDNFHSIERFINPGINEIKVDIEDVEEST